MDRSILAKRAAVPAGISRNEHVSSQHHRRRIPITRLDLPNHARLPAQRRSELAAGCTAIANNHCDTDGACALFAVKHPEAALARADQLLEAAWAGDFFRAPSERAVAIDLVVAGLYDAERSPWRDRFAGLDARARHAVATEELVARFAQILDGDLVEYADLWRNGVEALSRAALEILS